MPIRELRSAFYDDDHDQRNAGAAIQRHTLGRSVDGSLSSSPTEGIVYRLRQRYGEFGRMQPRFKGVRAYLNWLHGYYELKRGASRLKARPVKLIFDPTNACQLACPLCPTGLGMIDRRTGHASLDLFRRLMDQVGDYVFLVDFYNWGDPLLNPRLNEFIAIAHSHNVISTISSNLSFRLTDQRIHQLLTSGVSEIIISLDGASAATHERYRRKSDFDLICANMRRLAEARRALGQSGPLLTWQYVVFSFNEHEIDQARTMATTIGIDRITFRPPFLQVDRYDLSDDDKREIRSWSPSDPKYQSHIGDRPRRSGCGWHYTTVAINWDGTVTPCSTAFRKKDDFGTFGKTGKEQPFMEVVNNAAFQKARANVSAGNADGLICERCPTPSIQNYHHYVYRRIALITFVMLMQAVNRRLFALRSAFRRSAPVVAEPE